MSSVATGSPVRSRASARYFNPSSPNPWKAYGEVRGLNAPPRRNVAPEEATRSPSITIMSRPSTEQGPAIRARAFPPTVFPYTVMTVSSFLNSRLTSLNGTRIRSTFSTTGIPSNASGSRFRSSPIAPMIVRSTPREMCAVSPFPLIVSSICRTSSSVAPARKTMIICVFLSRYRNK